MNDLTEEESKCYKEFEGLCRELNMDKETEISSWKRYKEVSDRCTLDGESRQWFCCALYAECRQSFTPTVGGTGAVVVGNCVPLYKLLYSCKLSMFEFLEKIKIWHDMAKLSSQFLNHIKRLENSYGVDFTLFQHFILIMGNLYIVPPNEKKNTKYRSITKCSSNKLYEFVWYFYLCAKNENPSSTVDLVTSYSLLLCCIELIYKNVLAQNRTDLININFEGVPANWNKETFDPTCLVNYSILETLCQITDTIYNDVKSLKESTFNAVLMEFCLTQTLCGNQITFLDIISNENFDRNLKTLSTAYEQYVLSVGDFDARILLNNPNYRKINEFGETNKIIQHQEIRSLIPYTPYTRKSSLPSKDTTYELIANATNNVRKLQDIANMSEPTDFIRQAGDETMKKIAEHLKRMSEQFYDAFPNSSESVKRFSLATSLFYYLLDKIIRAEIRNKPQFDKKSILDTDIFITTLIACSVEIILDAYKSQVKFPWVLNCFSIMAYNFYKNIEIVVRLHEGVLTRELIKHLNVIEETCLESLVWNSSSNLWSIIDNTNNHSILPSWADVDLRRRKSQLQSPINSSSETFTFTNSNESAKRDLFNAVSENPITTENPMKRAASLPLFLRKVYQLSWLRIKELCTDLRLDEEKHLNTIWTLFERSITHNVQLMRDRHLDQIIMCAIYLYIKVAEIPAKMFSEIMKHYRKQPQATSSVYREVLINSDNDKKEYNDIIYFYNKIYVGLMTEFGIRFSEKKKSVDDLKMSPHPLGKNMAPRKVSSNTQVYVSPMEKNEVTHSPNHITYRFNQSPSKVLQNMNDVTSKRGLNFDGTESVALQKRPRINSRHCSRIHDMIKDRQE